MSLALALLLLAGPAAAGCLPKAGAEPVDLDALRGCHDKERQALMDAVWAKKGAAPTEAQLDALDERQRAEARDFLSRHTVGASDMDLASETPLEGGPKRPASKAAPKKRPAADKPASEEKPRGDGMTEEDYQAMKASLQDRSDGGKKGVTPEMAGDIRKMLMQKQGGVSPDMEKLLNATSRDGANLSQESMQLLRDAGKQAKGAGLQLGIGPDAEKQLLEEPLTADAPGTN